MSVDMVVKFQQVGADDVVNGTKKINNALSGLNSANIRSAMREQANLQKQLLSVSERRKALESKIQDLQNKSIGKATKDTQDTLAQIKTQKDSLIRESLNLRQQLKDIVYAKNKINTEVLKNLNFSIGRGVGSYTVNFADKLEDYIKKIPNLSLQKEKNRLKDFLLDNKKITQKDLKNFSNYFLPLDFKAKNGSIRTISTSEQINLIRSWLKGGKIYSSNASTPLQERVKDLITDNVVREIFKSYISSNLKPGEIGFQSVDSLKTAFNDFLNTGKTTKALDFLLKEKGFISSFKDTEKEKILNHLTKFKETGNVTPELKDIITNMFSSSLKTDEENKIYKNLKENSDKINELTKRENKIYKNISKDERLEDMQKKYQELQSNEKELKEKVKDSEANIPKEIEKLRKNVRGQLNSEWIKEQVKRIENGEELTPREVRNIKGQMRSTLRNVGQLFSALNIPIDVKSATLKEFQNIIKDNKALSSTEKILYENLFKSALDYVDLRDKIFSASKLPKQKEKETVAEDLTKKYESVINRNKDLKNNFDDYKKAYKNILPQDNTNGQITDRKVFQELIENDNKSILDLLSKYGIKQIKNITSSGIKDYLERLYEENPEIAKNKTQILKLIELYKNNEKNLSSLNREEEEYRKAIKEKVLQEEKQNAQNKAIQEQQEKQKENEQILNNKIKDIIKRSKDINSILKDTDFKTINKESKEDIANIKDVLQNNIQEIKDTLSKNFGLKNLSSKTKNGLLDMLQREFKNNPILRQNTNTIENLFDNLIQSRETLARLEEETKDIKTPKTVEKITGFKRNHPYGVGYLNYGLPTVSQKQIEFQQRQQEINNANMSLYASSHALKAIEGTMQQGYEIGKGNIDEYVRFQSATVGVAKLLPVLRDKDTLLVNEKFREFRQGILDLTETLPRSGVELAQASEVAARLGVTNPDQIRKVVEAGTKLGVAFGMAPNEVTNNIVKIANAKGIDINKSNSMEKIMEFADAINYLDDHTAASGREIINFTKKAVQTAEGVKMDTKDVSAFGASLVSLGISSDQANTAFKNLMTVLQTGPRNRKTGVEYLEKSGYNVKQLTTEFKKNPTKTAVEFIKRLNKLRNAPAGADAAAIVRFAFGQMSAQGIMALVNNPEVLEKYLKMARSDSLNWTEKEFQARQKNDPAVQFKLLDNAVKKLQIDTGEMLMPIAQAFINDIKSFSKQISPAVKEHGDILRTGAYAGLGLLGLTKVGGFITDTAMLSNNLRNFKWYNDFVKSKYKTNKLSYNAPMILTNGELINGVWNKGTSIKNNRNLWNRFSFRAGVYGGKKEFLQLYRQFGSMRNNPAMYNNGKAIGELANVTKAMNAMKWKGGLQAGLALLPTLFSIPTLAGLAGIGTATYFTANYVSGQIDKKFIEAEKKRKNIIGTKKEREYRNNRLHSNVFQYEKLYKLQNELNKRGYEVANVNGDFIVNKLIKDKKGNVINKQRLKEERKNGGISYYLQEGTNAEKWGLSKGELLFTENNGADFLNLVDEIKYLKSQQKASETRAGIKPTIIRNEKGQIIDKNTQKQLNYQDPITGEMINYVHPTNIEGWNWLSNEQRRASKVAKEQAEKKQKLLKKQKKAEEEGDIENFYSTTQALDSLRKNIIKTEEYEKNLRKRGAETDWEEESGFDIYKYAPKHSLQRKLNKSTQKHYLNILKVYGFDKFGTEEQQTWALNLAERLEQQEYWEKMRKNLGIAKQNKEKGIKDFYGESFVYDNNKLNPLGVNGYQQANDTLYRLNQEIIQLKAKLGEQSKDVKPISQFQYDKFDFTNGFMTEEFNKALSSQQKENIDNLNKQKETTKAIADNYSTVKTNSTEAFSAINSGAKETNQQISSIDSMLKSIATTLVGLTTGNHVIKIGFSLASSIPQLVPQLTGGGGNKKGGKRKGYNTYENEDD